MIINQDLRSIVRVIPGYHAVLMGRTIYTCFMYDNRKYHVNSFIGHSVVLQYVTVHRLEQI